MKRFLLLSCLTLLSATSLAQVVPMTNEECTTAITLFDGINPSPPAGLSGNVFTNVGSLAAVSAGSPAFNCGSGANSDVWFAYTASMTGVATFSTCTPGGFAAGTHTDTILQVLDGSACPPVTILGCDDDACATSPGLASTLTVPVTGGAPYFVRIASWSGTTDGTFYIAVSVALPPANDECTGAISVFDGVNPGAPLGASGLTFDNTGASTSAGPAYCVSFSKDVWFSYTATATGPLAFQTCTPAGFASGTNGDTALMVTDTTGGACPAVTSLACNDDTCGLLSNITVAVTAGTTYFVRVASWSSTPAGTFYLSIAPPPPGPANDECAGAIPVFDGVNPSPPLGASGSFFDNTSATSSAGPAFSCSSFSKDIWFSYTATFTGPGLFETCTPLGFASGSLFDTTMQVTDSTGGGCPAVTELGCNDQFCGGLSRTIVPVAIGTTYFVRVASWSSTPAGTFYLRVGPTPPPPPNDDCIGAIPLATGPNGPFSNDWATDSGVISSCGVGGAIGSKDVWFSYTTGPCPSFTLDTCGTFFDTVVGIYDVCGGTELACNDDDPTFNCGLSSVVSYVGTPFTTYMVKIGSWSTAATGSFNVNIAIGAGMALNFSSPFGPGSVQIDINDGPPGGTYVWLITGFAGAFPNGWLDGLDIPLNELLAELNAGFPFIGPLDGCGNFSTGPIGGVGFLSGIPLYSIAYGIPSGGVVPTANSAAITYTIP